MHQFKCRHCSSDLKNKILSLGHQPPSNKFLSPIELESSELNLPLDLFFCGNCGLVQLPSYSRSADLFTSEYPYLSSTSQLWCQHASNYVENVIDRFEIDTTSFVVEVASNDGYLLQYFQRKDSLSWCRAYRINSNNRS